jgi:3-isopropylmalate/(R)-2-methylmalate dehydratase large subunit
MSMTVSEKILAAHCGRDKVEPGEFIEAKVDLCLGNDITAPIAIQEFEEYIGKTGRKGVFDPSRVCLVPDHFTPNKDIKSAQQVKILREFSKKYGLENYFEVGEVGIEHVLLPEKGLVVPGDLVIGADSHTCTYGGIGAFATGVGSTDLAACMIKGTVWLKVPESIRFVLEGKLGPWVTAKDLILFTIGKIGVSGALYQSMEFAGSAIDGLSVEGRLTMANMAIEAGAKNGIFPVDKKTLAYCKGRAKRPVKVYQSDKDAKYCAEHRWDVSKIEPQVSLPHLPENAKNVSEVRNVSIDQAVIGSCTNGRIEDLRLAAKVLKGRKVHKYVRAIIFPGTQAVWLQADREGLMETFVKAGCVVSPPTCGPCLGGHMGILADGEKAVATTNRNFVGRMGHVKSEVYLAGVPVAAASAVLGRIGSPEEIK